MWENDTFTHCEKPRLILRKSHTSVEISPQGSWRPMTYASNRLKYCQEITGLAHIDPVWLAHLHDSKRGTIFRSAGGKQRLNDGADNEQGVKQCLLAYLTLATSKLTTYISLFKATEGKYQHLFLRNIWNVAKISKNGATACVLDLWLGLSAAGHSPKFCHGYCGRFFSYRAVWPQEFNHESVLKQASLSLPVTYTLPPPAPSLPHCILTES